MAYTFKTKPEKYQLIALKKALKAKKYGIFFQQRVGKTKVAIDFTGALHKLKGITNVMIICPLSVRSEWEAQIAEHLPVEDYVFYYYPKTKKKRQQMLEEIKNTRKLTYVCINYDVLKSVVDLLKGWAEVIIFDESHMLRSYTSVRSRAAWRLAKDVEYKLLLTGTPTPKPWHIFSQFRVMDETIFGTRWADFRDQYCVLGGYLGKEIIGYKNVEKLSEKIAQNSIRILRKDVMKEPEVEDVIIPVVLEPQARELYEELKQVYIAELEKGKKVVAEMAATRLMRLQQICGGFATTEDGDVRQVSSAKMDTAIDLVKTKLEGGEKVVVFFRFKPELHEFVNRAKNLKVPVYELHGGVDESLRKRYRDLFQQNDEPCVMAVQIATGCMGITLDTARTNIFYSVDFVLDNFQQARDRIMGRGQKANTVTNYFLQCKGTVDVKIIRTLRTGEDLIKKILDDWRDMFV